MNSSYDTFVDDRLVEISPILVVQFVVCSVILQNILFVLFVYTHRNTHKTWSTRWQS
jgi:hypothetical protein